MKKYLLLLISAGIVFLDQISKYIIRNAFYYGESRTILGNFLRFTYRRNPNAVFGIRIGGPLVALILTVIAFIFVCFLFYKSREKLFNVALSFIIGGAVGNLIDRILFREVTDFIDMGVGSYRFATFNVADSFVTIGIFLSFISYFLECRAESSDSP